MGVLVSRCLGVLLYINLDIFLKFRIILTILSPLSTIHEARSADSSAEVRLRSEITADGARVS